MSGGGPRTKGVAGPQPTGESGPLWYRRSISAHGSPLGSGRPHGSLPSGYRNGRPSQAVDPAQNRGEQGARLRESKQKWDADEAARGRESGLEWALTKAGYEELYYLARDAVPLSGLAEKNPKLLPETIAQVSWDGGACAGDFWPVSIGEAEVSPAFAAAFLVAVLEVWDEIEDQM